MVVGSAAGKPAIREFLGDDPTYALDINNLIDHLKNLYLEFRFNGSPLNNLGYDNELSLQAYEGLLNELVEYQDNLEPGYEEIDGNPVFDLAIRYLDDGGAAPQTYRRNNGDRCPSPTS